MKFCKPMNLLHTNVTWRKDVLIERLFSGSMKTTKLSMKTRSSLRQTTDEACNYHVCAVKWSLLCLFNPASHLPSDSLSDIDHKHWPFEIRLHCERWGHIKDRADAITPASTWWHQDMVIHSTTQAFILWGESTCGSSKKWPVIDFQNKEPVRWSVHASFVVSIYKLLNNVVNCRGIETAWRSYDFTVMYLQIKYVDEEEYLNNINGIKINHVNYLHS